MLRHAEIQNLSFELLKNIVIECPTRLQKVQFKKYNYHARTHIDEIVIPPKKKDSVRVTKEQIVSNNNFDINVDVDVDVECPICYMVSNYIVETMCGHIF